MTAIRAKLMRLINLKRPWVATNLPHRRTRHRRVDDGWMTFDLKAGRRRPHNMAWSSGQPAPLPLSDQDRFFLFFESARGSSSTPDTSTAPPFTATTAVVRTLRNAYAASLLTLDTRTPGRVDSGVFYLSTAGERLPLPRPF
jgi:hypothetical protein